MAPVDYRSTVVLDHLPPTLAELAPSPHMTRPLIGNGEAMIRITSYRNMEVELEVNSERDLVVVLNDIYYPCWRVFVDGRERELLQANYLFRGVHVRAGERRVIFQFAPFSLPAVKGTWARLTQKASAGRPGGLPRL